MRRSERPTGKGARHSAGFTLVEAVMVNTNPGVMAAMVASFIVQPVRAYLDTAARAVLVDNADLALRRIGRDLRIALPNSVRVTPSGLALELIPTSGGARYASQGSGALQAGVLDSSFELIGPPLTLSASQSLVFYNLGTGVTGSDAYAPNATLAEQATSNRRTSTNAAGTASTITLSTLAALPAAAVTPPYRVMAVDSPVSYRCDLAAGTLVRHQGYGFAATQPDPPGSGSSAVLATGVTACAFKAATTLVAARAALVNLQLTLAAESRPDERVTLNHAVFVDNLP
jgi:MSHA biogenesis protein MshO